MVKTVFFLLFPCSLEGESERTTMKVCKAEEFSTQIKFGMLSFLIVLHDLTGVQGKAFLNRYKRDNEDSYHYIPVEEGIVQLQARYSPESLPDYQDYGYVQANRRDWSVYYHQPMVPQPIQDPLSNINEHHKTKAKHTWHFNDQNRVPITQYMDGRHFESSVEAPNVNEALLKKEVIYRHGTEYDVPIIVEALIKKSRMDHENAEIPAIIDSLTIKERPIKYEYDGNPIVIDSTIKRPYVYEYKNKLSNLDLLTEKLKPSVSYDRVKINPVAAYDSSELSVLVDSLGKKDKPIEVEPSTSYYMYEPIKEKPIKEVPFISSIDIELPVIVESPEKKDKPIKVEPADSYMSEPIMEKPVKDDTVVFYDAPNYSARLNSFYKVNESEDETSIVETLVRKEKPTFHVEEFETPIIVEALVRKLPVYENKRPNTKEDKILPQNFFHPIKDSILVKDESFHIPVVEALTFEQDIDRNETSKEKDITFDETHGFNEPDTDNLDEKGDHGSEMDFDRSRFARSFLPVNLNAFSTVTNIKLEKLKFKSCVTPKNETGSCMSIQLCSVSSTISNIDELLRNICLIGEIFIGVCCPEFPVETVRVDWEQLKPSKEMLNEKKSQISKECGRLPSMVTDRDPWPWMASLIAKSSDKIFCGGALINEQYVLTAAHCTIRILRNQILVRLGRPASENRPQPDFEVIEIKRHAGYNPRTMQNDIAVLKLSRRVQLGHFRRVVCLSKDKASVQGLVNESASLLRWKETPGEIKDVESLLVISSRECQSRMRTAISDSILCTEPRTDETMCNADSGAPLIIAKNDKFEVIGILTWNRNDCDERFPTVFTRVSSYRQWIEKLAS